jgi:hypothetical protein
MRCSTALVDGTVVAAAEAVADIVVEAWVINVVVLNVVVLDAGDDGVGDVSGVVAVVVNEVVVDDPTVGFVASE